MNEKGAAWLLFLYVLLALFITLQFRKRNGKTLPADPAFVDITVAAGQLCLEEIARQLRRSLFSPSFRHLSIMQATSLRHLAVTIL